jgi:hypothetical protein
MVKYVTMVTIDTTTQGERTIGLRKRRYIGNLRSELSLSSRNRLKYGARNFLFGVNSNYSTLNPARSVPTQSIEHLFIVALISYSGYSNIKGRTRLG